MLLSFVNGDAHYMPDEDAFGIGANGLGTTEAQRSGFAPGAAEQLVIEATDLLDTLDD
jgi:hypothetical protein